MVEDVAVNSEALVEDRDTLIQLRLKSGNSVDVLAEQMLDFV